MAVKRKRKSSPLAVSVADALPSNEAGPSQPRSKKSRVAEDAGRSDTEGVKSVRQHVTDQKNSVKIVFELVGSVKSYTRPLDEKPLHSLISKVANKLDVPLFGMRIAHVRSIGVETDIWDDFDLQALKARALATGSKGEVIRVYSTMVRPSNPSILGSTQLTAASSSPFSRSHMAFSPRPSVATPRSALRTPSTSENPRSQKRVHITLPNDSPPSTPSPLSRSLLVPTIPATATSNSSESPVTSPTAVLPSPIQEPDDNKSNRRRRRQQRKSLDATHPSSPKVSQTSSTEGVATSLTTVSASMATGSPSTHDPPSHTRPSTVSKVMERYKPTRPSPLGRAATTGATGDDETKSDTHSEKDQGKSSLPSAVGITVESVPKTATPIGPPTEANECTTPSESQTVPAMPTVPINATPKKGRARSHKAAQPIPSTISDNVTDFPSLASSPVTSMPTILANSAQKQDQAIQETKTRKETNTQRLLRELREKKAAAEAARISASESSAASAATELSPSNIDKSSGSATSTQPASSTLTPLPVVEPIADKAENTLKDKGRKSVKGSKAVDLKTIDAPAPVSLDTAPRIDLVSLPTAAVTPVTHSLPPAAIVIDETSTPPATDLSDRVDMSSIGKNDKAKAALAHRAPCVLCGGPSDHLHKDCPTVQGGLERLTQRLAERHAELASEKKNTKQKKGRKSVPVDEDNDAGIEAIEMWIKRLTNVAAKVNGHENHPTFNPILATPILPIATTAIGSTTSAPVPSSRLVHQTLGEIADNNKRDMSPEVMDNALDPGGSPASASSSSSSSSRTSTPEPPISAAPSINAVAHGTNSTTMPETPFYPQTIHLKALAHPRRPGSMSGLSVSDAVIETGDSGSDSDDSVESDSGSDSDSSSSSSSSNSSSTSSSSGSNDTPVDSAALMRQIMTKPLSHRKKQRARLSAASMHPIDAEVRDMSDISDDEDLIHPKPTPGKARRGSESSIGDFDDGESVAASDIDSDDDNARPIHAVITVVTQKAGKIEKENEVNGKERNVEEHDDDLERIGTVGDVKNTIANGVSDDTSDDEANNKADGKSNGRADHGIGDGTESAVHVGNQSSGSSRRSFGHLTDRADSVSLDDLPGDIALRSVIVEETLPKLDAYAPSNDDVGLVSENSRHHGLPSSSSSSSSLELGHDDLPATQIRSLPEAQTPTPAKHRYGGGKKVATSHIARAPEGPPETDTPRRRLRSASREPAPSQVPPSQRVTRLSSQRMAPNAKSLSNDLSGHSSGLPRTARRPSNHQEPKAKGSSNSLGDDDENEATPRPTASVSLTVRNEPTRQRTRRSSSRSSSHIEELPSSYPSHSVPFKELVPSSSQANGDTSHFGFESEFPVSSQPSPTRHRGRLGSKSQEPAPLFMSQGSQMLETQTYNAFPAPLVPETQSESSDASYSQKSNGVTYNGVRKASPIAEEEEDATVEVTNEDPVSDGETVTTATTSKMYPSLPSLNIPIRRSSQPVPQFTSSFPTLSSLPKDILRQGRTVGATMWSAMTGRGGPSGSNSIGAGFSASQPLPTRDESSSDDGSGSESDDEVPEDRKARYAGANRKRKPSTRGVMSGW